MNKNLFPVLKILAGFWFASLIISSLFGFNTEISGSNIAVIPIQGIITVDETSGFGATGVSSEEILQSLSKAEESSNIKAIVLDINSPGGSGVAADEISQKIKSINKTTVAVIRELGASAAYWIASSTDYIFANRMSMTGSVGVIGSYLDFSGLLSEYNVTYQRYVSGDLKDMGSPFKEPSPKEQKAFQAIIDKVQVFFIEEVKHNRNLSEDILNNVSSGQILLGVEAKELGLIDELGTKQDAFDYLENSLNITAKPSEYRKKSTFPFFPELISSKIGKFINPNFQIKFI